jgi:hypothetical protein
MWGISGVPFGAYALIQGLSVPLILQPQLFGALCMLSFMQVEKFPYDPATKFDETTQCQYYSKARSKTFCISLYFSILILMAGIETGLVYAIRVRN